MEREILNKRIVQTEEVIYKALFSAIIFKVEHYHFGINISELEEIVFLKEIYSVPNATEKLLGVINLRGNIIPVFSLRLILGIQEHLKGKKIIRDEEKFIMILGEKRDTLGFVVDGIEKTISVTEANFRGQDYIREWSKNLLFDGVILDEDREIFNISASNLIAYVSRLK